MRLLSRSPAWLLVGFFMACSSGSSPPDASAPADASVLADAGASADASSMDTSAADAAPLDASPPDSGRPPVEALRPTWTSTFGNPAVRGRRLDLWGSIAVVDPEAHTLYLFGGNAYPNGATMNRHWRMSLDDGSWEEVSSGPAARYCHCAVLLPSTRAILMVGGRNDRGPLTPDAWLYAIDGETWTQVEGPVPTAPIGCSAAWMPTFPSGGRAIVFGGDGFQGVSAVTWAFDPDTRRFAQLSPAASPPGRRDGMLAFDPGVPGGPSRLLLFGGSTSVQPPRPLDDTWSFDGTTWAPVDVGPTRPSPRRYAGQAMEPTRRYWVLFGGTNEIASSDELWVFDAPSDRWHKLTAPDPRPLARAFTTLSWDEPDESFLLLGGLRLESAADLTRGARLRLW